MKPATLEELASKWENEATLIKPCRTGEDVAVFHAHHNALIDCARELREFSAWRLIETAPKDGTEILVWRDDAGALLARWIAPADFLHERELDGMKEADEPDWFVADFVSGGRLDGGNPTLWQPIPSPPKGVA